MLPKRKTFFLVPDGQNEQNMIGKEKRERRVCENECHLNSMQYKGSVGDQKKKKKKKGGKTLYAENLRTGPSETIVLHTHRDMQIITSLA